MKNTQPKQKKIPERRCTGCGESFPKKELIRVVRSPEGDVSIDFTGKKSGRGAYICYNVSCLNKARRSRRIERALECSIPEEVYNTMEAQLLEDDGE